MNFQVIFHLDGSGVFYDPCEPIHLDGLLAFALARIHTRREIMSRDEIPDDIPLPLRRSNVNGHQVWHASALFPDVGNGAELTEALRFWRKRFRVGRIEWTSGSPNTTNGTYRDYNMPLPLALVPRMIAYASGDRSQVLRILRRDIKYLGKKRAHGHGRVVAIEAEETPEDWSHRRDGVAMRWLPDPGGTRMVRPAPPYWNCHGRVSCCEVGDSTP